MNDKIISEEEQETLTQYIRYILPELKRRAEDEQKQNNKEKQVLHKLKFKVAAYNNSWHEQVKLFS